MDEDYLRSIRQWLRRAEPGIPQPAAGLDPEPPAPWIPFPRMPSE
ncbi:hypothetical protein [Amycolatopsis sp.]|nr:hypothetical protein [Amycolatopsis sp.]HVV14191.1 hypothetical protein [Amycolatopsis sp.]